MVVFHEFNVFVPGSADSRKKYKGIYYSILCKKGDAMLLETKDYSVWIVKKIDIGNSSVKARASGRLRAATTSSRAAQGAAPLVITLLQGKHDTVFNLSNCL